MLVRMLKHSKAYDSMVCCHAQRVDQVEVSSYISHISNMLHANLRPSMSSSQLCNGKNLF